jgi:hypothetical protein
MDMAQPVHRVPTYALGRLHGAGAGGQASDIRLERTDPSGLVHALLYEPPSHQHPFARSGDSMVPAKLDVRGTQILAKTLFKELRGSGYTPHQILGLSTELIDLVTKDLKSVQEPHLTTVGGQPGDGWRAAL